MVETTAENRPIPKNLGAIVQDAASLFRANRYINPATREPYFFRSAAVAVLSFEIDRTGIGPQVLAARLILELRGREKPGYNLALTELIARDQEIDPQEDPYFDLSTDVVESEANSLDPGIKRSDDRRYRIWDPRAS